MSKLVFAAALAAALVSATAAAARPVSARVFYGDLDLSTPKGAKLMLRRIHLAVAQLCAPTLSPVIVPPQELAQTRRCRTEAMQQAIERLRAPMVTAEYDRVQTRSSLMAAAK